MDVYSTELGIRLSFVKTSAPRGTPLISSTPKEVLAVRAQCNCPGAGAGAALRPHTDACDCAKDAVGRGSAVGFVPK
jgi:hypothetical protein